MLASAERAAVLVRVPRLRMNGAAALIDLLDTVQPISGKHQFFERSMRDLARRGRRRRRRSPWFTIKPCKACLSSQEQHEISLHFDYP